MARTLLILADGFEEIEAVTIADVLRRAGVDVVLAGLTGKSARGAHDIEIACDRPLEGLSADGFDAVVLPGGMPGSTHLRDSAEVRELVASAAAAGKLVAAICAAPIALDAAGVLAGKRVTSYPGFAPQSAAAYLEDRVVEDGNVVTSRGPGTALEFALTLVKRLVNQGAADKLRQGMLVA